MVRSTAALRPMPTSLRARAKRLFFTMLCTFRSSNTIKSGRSESGLVLAMIRAVAWCAASLRMLASRACRRATLRAQSGS